MNQPKITLRHPVTGTWQDFDLSSVDQAWLDARADQMDGAARETAHGQCDGTPADFFARYAALDPVGAATLAWAS